MRLDTWPASEDELLARIRKDFDLNYRVPSTKIYPGFVALNNSKVRRCQKFPLLLGNPNWKHAGFRAQFFELMRQTAALSNSDGSITVMEMFFRIVEGDASLKGPRPSDHPDRREGLWVCFEYLGSASSVHTATIGPNRTLEPWKKMPGHDAGGLAAWILPQEQAKGAEA